MHSHWLLLSWLIPLDQWSYIGWQKLNLLSHPNATLAPQTKQGRASGENLNYLLSHYSDILYDHCSGHTQQFEPENISWQCSTLWQYNNQNLFRLTSNYEASRYDKTGYSSPPPSSTVWRVELFCRIIWHVLNSNVYLQLCSHGTQHHMTIFWHTAAPSIVFAMFWCLHQQSHVSQCGVLTNMFKLLCSRWRSAMWRETMVSLFQHLTSDSTCSAQSLTASGTTGSRLSRPRPTSPTPPSQTLPR